MKKAIIALSLLSIIFAYQVHAMHALSQSFNRIALKKYSSRIARTFSSRKKLLTGGLIVGTTSLAIVLQKNRYTEDLDLVTAAAQISGKNKEEIQSALKEAEQGNPQAFDTFMDDFNNAVNEATVASWKKHDEQRTQTYLHLTAKIEDAKRDLKSCQSALQNCTSATENLRMATADLEDFLEEGDRIIWDRAAIEWDMYASREQKKKKNL